MSAQQLIQQARARPALAAAVLGATIALPPAFVGAYRDYQAYLAVGPGGIPYNVFGWLIQALIQPFSATTKSLTDPRMYTQPSKRVAARYAGPGAQSYLAAEATPAGASPGSPGTTLPRRTGSRPSVPGFVAPQRQTSDLPPQGTRAAQDEFLHALAAANPGVLEIRPSKSEGIGTPALWTLPAPAAGARTRPAATELCHAHGEGSSHMILSLPDAAQVLAQGWGQRHKLSGVRVPGGLTPTYVFVYAPRTADEMKEWKRLVVATARFAASGGPAETATIVVPE